MVACFISVIHKYKYILPTRASFALLRINFNQIVSCAASMIYAISLCVRARFRVHNTRSLPARVIVTHWHMIGVTKCACRNFVAELYFFGLTVIDLLSDA